MNKTKETCHKFKDFVEGLIRKYFIFSPTGVVYYTYLMPALLEYAAQISENHIPSRFIHGDNRTISVLSSIELEFSMLTYGYLSVNTNS